MHPSLLSILFACGQDQVLVKQENLPPQILITSHSSESTLIEGFEVEFRASVNDDDNNNNELLVRWSQQGEILCDWTPVSVDGESFCPLTLSPTTNQVVAEVKDPLGATGRSEINPTVLNNLPPTLLLDSPLTGDSYYANEEITFEMTLSDAEEDIENIDVLVTSSIDGELFNVHPDSNGSIQEMLFLSEGQHSIEIIASDTGGSQVVRPINLLIKPPNEPPICTIVSPISDANFLGGVTVDFTLTTTDVNIPNETLDVELRSSIDGLIPTTAPDANGNIYLSLDSLSLGRHSLTLTAEDEAGLSCTTSQLLIIDSTPVVSINQPLDGSVFSMGEIVEFQGRVLDQEDLEHEMTLEWYSDVDGLLHTDLANSQGRQVFFTSDLSVGPHDITLSSTDSGGHSDTQTIQVRINTPPTSPVVSFQPNPIYGQNELIATPVGATDVDGDTLTYTYEWFRNGTLTAYNSDTIPSWTILAGDTWTARITPDDGYSTGTPGEDSITIENNLPIFTSSTTINQYQAEVGSTLYCSAQAEDIDDGVLTISYEWMLDGTSVANGSQWTVPLNASVGSAYTCTAIATDSNGATISDAISGTVGNTEPIVQTPVITSVDDTYFITSELECNTTVTDPNESLTPNYLWEYNGSALTTGNTISLSDFTIVPGSTLYCIASASDSNGGNHYATQSVNVCTFTDCDESLHLGNGYGIDWVNIPNGGFMMGSSPGEPGRDGDETQYPATLSNDFHIATTEITQGMYEEIMGPIWTSGQSTLAGEGDYHPVAFISWHMAVDFANHMTQLYNQTHGTSLSNCYSCQASGTASANCITLGNPYQCTGFRLPTEVEWEYVARSGTTSTYWTLNGGGNLQTGDEENCTIGWTLDDGSSLGDYAWYCARNIVDESKAVAQNEPNDFGVYDLHGNVWEWCHDGYQSAYPNGATTNYTNLSNASARVLRGGDWQSTPIEMRIANRSQQPPLYRLSTIGFRLARTQ